MINGEKYVKGANLFDYQTMADGVTGYYLLSDGSLQQDGSWNITDYIPCDGINFVLSKVGGKSPSMCFYDSNKQFISGQAYNTGGSAKKQDIYAIASSNAKFIRFTYMSPTAGYPDDLSAIMLNAGTTAIPYEPYGDIWADVPISTRKYINESWVDISPKQYVNGEWV